MGDFRSVAILTNAQNINISGFLHENFGDQQNPNLLDSDGDGLPDAWERIHGFSMVLDNAEDDVDEDGLSAIQEYALSTNPLLADSDGDGLLDGAEINDYQSNPLLKIVMRMDLVMQKEVEEEVILPI